MRNVHRTELAERDLEDIFKKLEHFSPNAADVFDAEFNWICRLIASQPGVGRAQDEWCPGLRSILMNRYLLFFQVIDDTVYIIRIIYATRDLNSIEFPAS